MQSETNVTRTCTTLDHIYPFTVFGGKPHKGTKCYCGTHKWGFETRPQKKVTHEEDPKDGADFETAVDVVSPAEGEG